MISVLILVEVTYKNVIAFSKITDDWNLLRTHTDRAITKTAWSFENSSILVSGKFISLCGSAIP